MKDPGDWINSLGAHALPVLRGTVEAIARLRKIEDTVTARTLAEVVLRDPLMVLRLLRYSQSPDLPADSGVVTGRGALQCLQADLRGSGPSA